MRLMIVRHPVAIIAFACLLLAWPMLRSGFPPSNSDGPIHIRWLHHVATQFWSGEMYPRYFPELNNAFGIPAFFYYPPLSTMAGVPFWHIVPENGREWYALGWGSTLGLILSGVFMWMFLKRSLG